MVDIRNVEFRKEYHYFITFQLDDDEGKVISTKSVQLNLLEKNRHLAVGCKPRVRTEYSRPTIKRLPNPDKPKAKSTFYDFDE